MGEQVINYRVVHFYFMPKELIVLTSDLVNLPFDPAETSYCDERAAVFKQFISFPTV